MPCPDPVTRARLPVRSKGSSPLLPVPRQSPSVAPGSECRQLAHSRQARAKKRIGVDIEELYARLSPALHLVLEDKRSRDLAGGPDLGHRTRDGLLHGLRPFLAEWH